MLRGARGVLPHFTKTSRRVRFFDDVSGGCSGGRTSPCLLRGEVSEKCGEDLRVALSLFGGYSKGARVVGRFVYVGC